jgi:hypothetical protein
MDSRITIAVTSAVGGFALGYLANSRRLRLYYENQMQNELRITNDHFKQRLKDARDEMDREIIARDRENVDLFVKAEKAWEEYYAGSPETVVVDPGPELEDLMKDRQPKHSATQVTVEALAIDQRSALVANKEPVDMTKPYVISEEDFFSEDTNYGEATYTYYAGDDTLTGEGDEIMDLQTRNVAVGDCLQYFGEQTTLYIRNNKLEMNIEVNRSDGKYSVEVAGLGDDSP